ncbi:MAG: hypothetical protein L3J71_02540 [Victivallaceae bacterium]|nr:hypothetical protein [Victivallaceae bacterium]
MKTALTVSAILLAVTLTGCIGSGGSGGSGTSSRYNSGRKGWVDMGQGQSIKPNAYGLGVHMDQSGRPVRTVPANGF